MLLLVLKKFHVITLLNFEKNESVITLMSDRELQESWEKGSKDAVEKEVENEKIKSQSQIALANKSNEQLPNVVTLPPWIHSLTNILLNLIFLIFIIEIDFIIL